VVVVTVAVGFVDDRKPSSIKDVHLRRVMFAHNTAFSYKGKGIASLVRNISPKRNSMPSAAALRSIT